VAVCVPASAADEVFSVTSVISLPANSPGLNNPGLANHPLASFDIEFVDPAAGVLLLADRSNKSIDVASTSRNLIIGELQPVYPGATPPAPPTFTGAAPFPFSCPSNCAEQNGVLSIHQYGQGEPQGKGRGQAKTEVWATDGFSRVWVINLKTGIPVVPPISTALGGPGTDPARADELCYDPDDGIILVANPA
jgi:hypothetical protein